MQSKYADLDGVRLNYGESSPNGPKLVFLSGFPGAWEELGTVLELLATDHHVFAPSMRGMGSSQRADAYPIPSYIDDTGAFIRQVVGAPVLGVGHSAGAWFGLGAAVADGGLFSAFVSLDQPLDPQAHVTFHENRDAAMAAMVAAMRAATSADYLAQLLADVPASSGEPLGDLLDAQQLADHAAELVTYDPEIFGAWVDDGLESWIVIPELDAWPGVYRNPVLFIDGDPEAGAMVGPAAAEYNLARYPWGERIEMPGYDHSLRLNEEPERVIHHIRGFFATL